MRAYPHLDFILSVSTYDDSYRRTRDIFVVYSKIWVAGGCFCLLEYSLDMLEWK